MKTLIDALGWRDGSRAWAMTPQGKRVTVEYQGKKSPFWNIWSGVDRPQDIIQVHQEVALMGRWPNAYGVTELLRAGIQFHYSISIDAPIWQEVTE